MGDGLALGLNSYDIKSFSYNDYLKEKLLKNGKKVYYYNYSKKNKTIVELINDIIHNKDQKLKNYLQTSDLIILSIGEKELLDHVPMTEIKENLDILLTEIKKYNNHICLLGHYPNTLIDNQIINNLNSIYQELAKSHNIAFVNLENFNDYLVINNNAYPTNRGYAQISSIIMNVIKYNK